jgi:hypothetical protein
LHDELGELVLGGRLSGGGRIHLCEDLESPLGLKKGGAVYHPRGRASAGERA